MSIFHFSKKVLRKIIEYFYCAYIFVLSTFLKTNKNILPYEVLLPAAAPKPGNTLSKK
jgi:hypothetical protein